MAIAAELIQILGFKIEGEQNLKRWKSEFDKAEKDAKKKSAAAERHGRAIGAALGGALLIGGAVAKKLTWNMPHSNVL